MSKSYENLNVWKEAIELGLFVYALTKKFPKDELFGMTSQVRRAVVSISANIAEGSGRSTKKEFGRFVDIARGSLNETESLLILAHGLGFIDAEQIAAVRKKCDNLGGSLGGFKNYLKKKI